MNDSCSVAELRKKSPKNHPVPLHVMLNTIYNIDHPGLTHSRFT